MDQTIVYGLRSWAYTLLRTGNGVIMMNEVSIDVSCSYQTNYVVEIATNVIADDQSVDLDEHDGEFQFGIMVNIACIAF